MVMMLEKPVVKIGNHENHNVPWVENETQILRQNYNGTHESILKSIRLITEKCGKERTYYAIRHKAAMLGLTRNVAKHSNKWTKKQEEELAELVGKFPAQIIAEKLERSLRSVYQKCHRLNLSNHIKNGWYSATDVSEILGVTEHLVVKWIHEKKLKATMQHRSLWNINTKDDATENK